MIEIKYLLQDDFLDLLLMDDNIDFPTLIKSTELDLRVSGTYFIEIKYYFSNLFTNSFNFKNEFMGMI